MNDQDVVDEVRKTRDDFAKRNDYDIDKIVRALQAESEKHHRKLVESPPRPLGDDDLREAG